MGRKDKPVDFQDLESLPLGGRLRLARQAKDVRLSEMAKRLGYTRGHLSAVELGLGRPSPELVDKYERELGVEPGALSRAEQGQPVGIGRRWSPISEELLDLVEAAGKPALGSATALREIKDLLDTIERVSDLPEESLAILAGFIRAGLIWVENQRER